MNLLRVNKLANSSLISMAAAARNGNFVRPLIVPGGEKLKILNGVHPLAAELCEFVPNTTHLNGEQRVVMITGPNASGKSVYLKQVNDKLFIHN